MRVLIPVHSGTWFIELQRVARLCRRSGRYAPVLLFVNPYPHRERDVATCQAEGMQCLDENGSPIGEAAEGAEPQLALRVPVGPLTRLIGRFLPAARELAARLDFARRVVAQVRPALVVMAGDNAGYDTPCFIRAAHAAGVRVVLVPSTMSNGLEEAEVYSKMPSYLLGSRVNRVAAALFPKWVRDHKGVRVLRVPGDRVLALEALRLAPPVPWTFNSGFADAIAAESDAMRDYYLENGIPPAQLADCGSLANDALHAALAERNARRRALCAELGLADEKPILLTALPPDFLYLDGGRPECDFRRYEDLVNFWIDKVATVRNFSRVVCLHPSVSYEEFRHIEKSGVRIARRPTADLIPLCDLYVASVSSTIRWAIACGIPVVNYDVYRYRYTDFLQVPGVLKCEEQAEFAELLRRFDTEPSFMDATRRQQASAAPHWGRVDGKAGERMLALFERLATAKG